MASISFKGTAKIQESNTNNLKSQMSSEFLQNLNLQEKIIGNENENNDSSCVNSTASSFSTTARENGNSVINSKSISKQKNQDDYITDKSISQIMDKNKEQNSEKLLDNSTPLTNQSIENVSSENIVSTSATVTDSNEKSVVTPARKRGRPRKSDVVKIPVMTSDESVTIPTPRRRGRPKKEVIDESHNSDDNTNSTDEHNDSLNESTSSLNNSSVANDNYGSTASGRRIRVRNIKFLRERSSDNDLSDEDFEVRSNGRSTTSRSRGRGRGRGRGRSRGRPRGGGTNHDLYDPSYTPDHSMTELSDNIFIPEVKLETVEGAKVDAVPATVKCGKCEIELHKTQWYHHNLWKHNNLGWRDGEEPPDYAENSKLLNKVLADAIKKRQGQLTCELCGMTKRSVVGFVSHLTFCGKSDEEKKNLLSACDICGALLMPVSMVTHKKSHLNKDKESKRTAFESVISSPERASASTEKKSRRRAAEKAVSRISEFTTAIVKEELIVDEKPSPSMLRQFVQRPQMTKRVPGIVKKVWMKEVAAGGEAKCRQPGCSYSSSDVEVMVEHYSTCKFTPRKNFACKICNFQTMLEEEINEHVREQHAEEDAAERFSGSDRELSYSDDDDPEMDSTAVVFAQPKVRLSAQVRLEKTMSLNRMAFMKSFSHKMRIESAYEYTLKWSLDFEMENYKTELFQNLEPHDFVAVNDEEAKLYAPKVETSMKTSVQKYEELSRNVRIDWKTWQRFEGSIDSNVPTFFCGGPIWAMAWLPIPSPMYSQDVEQFLAISTHIDMDTEYGVESSHSGYNVIQLWNMGDLDLELKNINTPELSYAIIHNHGTAWCMDWCPSSCYEDERLYNFERSEGRLRRMGLLAAAFSDGCICVYSMVFPEELRSAKSERHEYPFYKTKPVRVLVFDSDSYQNDEQNWQCTKLSWTKEADHDIIIAGFSNGYIALWDITTQSPHLLTEKPDGTVILDPFQKFHAHSHSVTMISMIPYANKRYCVSGSLDRNLKVWDLEDTTCPVSKSKHGIIVDGVWMTHWPCAAVVFDNALGLNASGSYFLPLREFEYKHFQLLNAGCSIFAIGANDFVNSISEGTVSGDIYAMFPPQLVYLKDIESIFTKTRYLCSAITIVDFESNDEKINAKGNRKKKKGDEYNYLPSTYSECKDRFGLVFTDEVRFTFRKKGRKITTVDTNHPINVEQHPFTSVNRTSWNPNAWSHLWLAAGYQNGLVRLFNFKTISIPKELNSLLSEHTTMFMKKAEDAKMAQYMNSPPE